MLQVVTLIVALLTFFPGKSHATLSGMNLIGKGEVYYMGLIKVYDAALYAHGQSRGEEILEGETSHCLKLTYDMSLAVKDFVLGAETVLSRQNPPEVMAHLREKIDLLHGAYRDVKKGDSYFLCYDAAQDLTTLTLNDNELVAVPTKEFADAYFGIWLGAVHPIDQQLRERLLKRVGKRPGA